jgi:integrase
MRGHIRKRGKRSWSIILDLGRDPSGKRRQKWHAVKGTKQDAQRELAKILHQMNTGAYVEPTTLTVADYLNKWLQDYAKVNVSGKTYERYEGIVKHHLIPALGQHQLSRLAPLHVQAYYSQALTEGRKDKRKDMQGGAGLSAQSVLHHHRVLHKALALAVRWQLLGRNPADAVEPPRPEVREMSALDEDQSAALIDAAVGTRLHIPVLLALTTGMRRGEILALAWPDVDLRTGRLYVHRALEETREGVRIKDTKTRRGRRRISLPNLMVAALTQHREQQDGRRELLGPAYQNTGLVCSTEDGSIWKPSAFTSAYRDLLRRRGIANIGFHALRHAHASQLLKNNVNPKIISERLGHSKVAFTLDTYAHLLPGMQDQAAISTNATLGAALGRSLRKRSKSVA